ncbi:MAG: NAD-dependent epimerase/dehydratase family protein [Halioglobus sp.]
MRVVVIGATGHIGTFLVPRLVAEGFEVIAVSRQRQNPYRQDSAWKSVRSISLDRAELESEGRFGEAIAKLGGDIIIDLICFTQDSARQLVTAVGDDIQQLLHCGTIWVYGASRLVPTSEDQPRQPLGDYGRNKAAIESWLLNAATESSLPVTILHPGHIVGAGWMPLNPAGNFNAQIFDHIAAGNEVLLPNMGMETLHHVHADDVAQAFMLAIRHRENAIGESFNIVSDAALTLNGYCEALAQWLDKPSNIRHLPLDQWRERVSEEDYQASIEHLSHGSHCSNAKARQLLSFEPRFSSIEGIQDSLAPHFGLPSPIS